MPLLNIEAGIQTSKRWVLFCLSVCFNQIETIADDDSGIFCDDQFDGIDSGITRRKIRCKSAYPRLVSTPIPQNTNVGLQQLQVYFLHLSFASNIPWGIFLFKFNNGNTRTMS